MSAPEPSPALTRRAPAGAAEALAEILDAIPEPFLPVTVELRATQDAPEPGPLLERITIGGAAPPEIRVAGGDLEVARLQPDPALLRDHSDDPHLRTWIRVPVCFRDVPAPLCVFIGCSRSHEELASEDLDRVAVLVRKAAHDAASPSRRHLGALFESLAEAVPVPVLVTDPRGRVIGLNSNLRFALGRHDATAPGVPMELLIPAGQLPYFQEALNCALEAGASHEIRLPPQSGNRDEIAFALSANMAAGSGADHVVIFVLREVSSGLELTRLAEKEREQNYVFQALVHDARTPLGAVTSGIEYLESAIAELGATASAEDRESAAEILGVVRHSATQIQHLLRDLNDYIAAQTGTLHHFDDVLSLSDLVRRAMESYRLAGGDRLELRVDGDATVAVQQHRMLRMLDNLISNALKYSPEDQPVELVIAPGREPRTVALEIRDHGPGIEPEFLSKIWDPYYRMKSATGSKVDGSGLGLSIVRQIVERHGGEIGVTSTPGDGSTFRLVLPVHG